MEESRRYEARKQAVAVAGFMLDLAFMVYVLASGFTFRLRDNVSGSVWSYALLLGGILQAIHLPLGFYSNYVLEHRFGLSRQSIGNWLRDQVVGISVGALIGLPAVGLMYYLIRAFPGTWWLYASIACIAFAVVITNLAPVILLPLFFKFKPVEDLELKRRAERLAERTRTPLCGVFEWSLGDKTRKANAAVVGWGNTRRIIVSDTLLHNFSSEEIEVIMAHELCHHVQNHIWKTIGLQAVMTVAGFYAMNALLVRFSPAFGFKGAGDVANLPFLILLASGASMVALPGVNWFSRRLEWQADRYALDLTDDPYSFVSGMEKLARLNLATSSPNRIIEFIFYSHPSIEKRIRMAADRVGVGFTS